MGIRTNCTQLAKDVLRVHELVFRFPIDQNFAFLALAECRIYKILLSFNWLKFYRHVTGNENFMSSIINICRGYRCTEQRTEKLGNPAQTVRHAATGISFLLAFWLNFVILPASAQDVGALQGKDLTPVQQTESLIESAIGGLSAAARISGTIDRVTVSEDSERRLKVVIQHSGLDATTISGDLRASDNRRQKQIRNVPVAAGSNQTELVFDLDPGTPEGTTLESEYLHLSVARTGQGVPGLARTFLLRKTWQSTIQPENVVVKILPKPIGTAANLGSQPTVQPVPTKFVFTKPASVWIQPAAPVVGTREAARAGGFAPVGGAGAPAPAPPKETSKQEVRMKTTAVVKSLPASARLMEVTNFRYGLPPEDQNKNAQGPSNNVVNLVDELRADDAGIDETWIAEQFPMIYQDRNASSGIFYYAPRAYHLEWDPDEKYGLRMLYGAATAAGQAGEVLMAARLAADVDEQLAEQLLQARARRTTGMTYNGLRRLPLQKAPDVSISNVLRQYNIPADKIVITRISDVLGEIEASWVTDIVTKENLQLALTEDVGVNGEVVFTSPGDGLPPQSIPLSIKLADPRTFGEIRWLRGARWRNRTPYTLRAKYLRALTVDATRNSANIYSWDLQDALIPPKAQLELDAGPVPAWLDGQAKRIWIDYGVVQDCHSCDTEAINSITGGVSTVPSMVTFHTITPLGDTGGYELAVDVRSKYFDPRSREIQTKPSLIFKADDQEATVGPVYLPQTTLGDPIFEYQIQLTMRDGTVRRSQKWTASDTLRVLIGKVQVEGALGEIQHPDH
jgi:hypothetical protein